LQRTAGPYIGVKSVALCNGRLRLDFRYTLLATKLARRCNMSQWAIFGLMHRSKYAVVLSSATARS
jgi:hypothetical protein